MKTLFALAFLLCMSVGYGLKCYECFAINAKSWDTCKNNTKEVTCKDDQDRCGKAFVEGSVQDISVSLYVKGCATKSDCDDASCKKVVQDPSTKITKCEFSCCSGDLCNGAKVPVVSVIMILACAIVAIFR